MTTGRFATSYRDTLVALRYLFEAWGVKAAEWQVERNGHEEEFLSRGRVQRRWVTVMPPYVVVSYYRQGQWQHLRCATYTTYDANLRAVYLLLDRMRISEGHGVSYGGLTSSRELVPVGAGTTRRTQLLAFFHLAGDAPFNVVEATWRRLVRDASDAGDDDLVKNLNNAFNELKKELQP
jgi:hypothetical protein